MNMALVVVVVKCFALTYNFDNQSLTPAAVLFSFIL